jgi:hypothetical protein
MCIVPRTGAKTWALLDAPATLGIPMMLDQD